jgi:hypothetical protein
MALVNPNIAMSFRQPEITPRNALAEYAQIQQIQGGQRQAEMADMQIQRMRQTDEALESVRQIAMKNGGPSDLNEIAKAYLGAPNQEMQQFGLGLLQKMRERSDFENTYKKLYPDTAAAAPTNAMASAGTPAPAPAPAAPASSMGQLGTGTFGMTPSAPMNAMAPAAPAAPAPVNALAAPAAPAGKTVADLRREIMLFSQSADPRAKAMVDVLKGQLTEMTKTNVVGGRLVSGAGNVLYTAPLETSDIKEYEYAKQNQGYKGSFTDFMQIKPTASAARSFTAVNTQLPASEEAQKEFMKEMRQTFSALKQAPTVLDNIEKAKALVPQAKGFMGAGGESILQAASFLNNRLGTSIDTKGVQNAEELRSRLFLGIMDNLKKLDSQPSQQQQAALQVALGSIGTDPSALPRVLDVFGDTIRQKVDLYNEEARGAEGRGVKFPYNPTIKLQPRPGAGDAGSTTQPRPAGVGANWTFERDASGNTAWVSPDRKSFKEAR